MTYQRRSFLRRSGAIAGLGVVAGCLSSGPASSEQVRSAAEEFADLAELSVALDAGYRSRATYVDTADGALGEVFVHQRAHEVTSQDDLDPQQPTLLFCRLDDDGRYDPVGVGWSIDETEVADTPELFDRSFHEPAAHPVPGQSSHYGLHAWVFADDVEDVFRPTHPSLAAPSFVEALTDVRSALGKFRTTADQSGADAATATGYENTEEHIFTDDGLYGVPFERSDIDETDRGDPPILLYRMTDQWFYELLGAEWYVPATDVDEPPSMFDQSSHEPLPGHSPHIEQPEHYGIHAWLFRANPAGMFALYNPRFR